VKAYNKAGWSEYGDPSAEIRPDAVPSSVTGFTTSDPLDKKITLSWNRVSGDFSAVLRYEIRWPGGKATAGAGESSKTVNVKANKKTTFSIWAVNRTGKSKKAATVEGWPTGPVGDFTIDEPHTVNATSSRSAVKLSWAAADPNGEGPTRYTVYVDGSAQCQPNQTATSCVTDGFALDGSARTITVKATNKPDHYPASEATRTWYSEGPPQPPTSPSVKATGTDRQLRVSFDVPALRSYKDGRVELRAAGGESRSWSVGKSGAANWSEVIGAGVNGKQSDVEARVCYSPMAGGDDSCTSWMNVGSDSPYGPLSEISASANKDGILMSASASANGNGRSATLRISGTDGTNKSVTGSGELRIDVDWHAVEPGSTVTYTATLESADHRPQGPDSREERRSATADSSSTHWERGVASTGCSWTSCYRVKLQLRNFRANSSVYCFVGGVGAPDWSHTFGVDGRGNWGLDNAPGLAAGDVSVTDDFGRCEQK